MKELFSGRIVFDFIQAKQREIAACADEEPMSVFGPALAGHIQGLADRFKANVPKLKAALKPEVTDEGARGATVRITVPFVGDGALFEMHPSQRTSHMPAPEVKAGALVFTYPTRDKNPAPIRAEFDAAIKMVEEALRQLEIDLHHYNGAVQASVESAFTKREAQLRATDELAKGLDFGKK